MHLRVHLRLGSAGFLSLAVAMAACGGRVVFDGDPQGFGGSGGSGAGTQGGGGSGAQGNGGSTPIFVCGDGSLGPEEQCDGGNLAGQSCGSLGFEGGDLGCTSSCTFDTSGCFLGSGEVVCDDWTDNDLDGLYDCSDPTECQLLDFCQPGDLPAGEPCSFAGECAANGPDPACLTAELGWPGGYCSEWCQLAVDDCTSGECVDVGVGNGLGLCLATCFSDLDCRPGYLCQPGQNTCFPGSVGEQESLCDDFTDDDFDSLVDCADPSACQGGPSCQPGMLPPGEPCFTHNDCAANEGDPACIPDFFGWPEGYCSEWCDPGLGDQACPSGSICLEAVPDTFLGLCFDLCSPQEGCRPGYECSPLGMGLDICTPPQ